MAVGALWVTGIALAVTGRACDLKGGGPWHGFKIATGARDNVNEEPFVQRADIIYQPIKMLQKMQFNNMIHQFGQIHFKPSHNT